MIYFVPALLALGVAFAPLSPLAAQEIAVAEPSQTGTLEQRTAQVVELLNGTLAPEEAIEVLAAVRDAVPSEIPVTVKLRRGFDEGPELEEAFYRIFEGAYDLGCAWTTVHCRTVAQKYKGPGRWSFLTDLVRRYPDRPILGSGDIWTVNDIFAMLEQTGVHAVSVARGCIGNPWIFQQARALMAGQPPTTPTIGQQRDALLEHFRYAVALHGEIGASRMMRKFGIKFSTHHGDPETVRKKFM